jgi:hypothetical protein
MSAFGQMRSFYLGSVAANISRSGNRTNEIVLSVQTANSKKMPSEANTGQVDGLCYYSGEGS